MRQFPHKSQQGIKSRYHTYTNKGSQIEKNARITHAKTTSLGTKGHKILNSGPGLGWVGAVSLLVVIVAVLLPPLPQPVEYHQFADQRSFFGISRFNDVMSNLAFLLSGAAGLVFLWRVCRMPASVQFQHRRESLPYWVLFSSIVLVAFGSIYYHRTPDTDHLLWDRLPIATGIAAVRRSRDIQCAVLVLERTARHGQSEFLHRHAVLFDPADRLAESALSVALYAWRRYLSGCCAVRAGEGVRAAGWTNFCLDAKLHQRPHAQTSDRRVCGLPDCAIVAQTGLDKPINEPLSPIICPLSNLWFTGMSCGIMVNPFS